MSIEKLLIRSCKQTVIYWGSPVNDGYGKMTFDNPVEIKCRWEDAMQVVETDDGKEIVSTSQLHVLQSVDKEGLVYLGELNDLTIEQRLNPYSISGINTVLKTDKIPNLSVNSFVRKVYTWKR